MKLNIHTDLDIIHWLWKQSSKQGAVKKLIREEIVREKSEDSYQRMKGNADRNPLRNDRGDISIFTCFFVVGIVMLVSFLLLYATRSPVTWNARRISLTW